MPYRINKKFIIQTAGDYTVIFDAEKSFLYTLNETASYILFCLKRSWTEEKIQSKLMEEFAVDKKTVEVHVQECLNDLLKKGLILKK